MMCNKTFQEIVLSKFYEISYRSKCISKNQNKKFTKWFIKKAKRELNWSKVKSEKEINNFYLTLNIKIQNYGSSNN